MAVSPRTRFEVFKRDEFTCRYCGKKSPEVVLEVDHIVPVARGGSDDEMNLATSCWACNRGKSDKSLNSVITGDDPHEKAIMLFERERQLEEYNYMLETARNRKVDDYQDLVGYWKGRAGRDYIRRDDDNWLWWALDHCPREQIRNFMDVAILRGAKKDFRFVGGCVRNWLNERRGEDIDG